MSSRLSSFASSISNRIDAASAGDAVAKVTAPASPVASTSTHALCAKGEVVVVECRLVLARAFGTLNLLLECPLMRGPVGHNTMLTETLSASSPAGQLSSRAPLVYDLGKGDHQLMPTRSDDD